MSRRTPREIDVTVTALGEDGFARGCFESRDVRVRNALPGETVRVRVLKRRRGIWYGAAETPYESSPLRVTPVCEHFPRCGGCTLQHLSHAAQLEHKHGLLLDALAAVGALPRRSRAPVAGPLLHYRHRARLGLRVVGDELLAGFREGFSNRVARIQHCSTLALPFARALPTLKATLARMSRPDRIPQVELAGGDRESAVVVRHLTMLTERDRDLLRAFSRESGLHVFLQSGGYQTVTPLQ
jgi:23S rRNA (uracil1939-C5)-methyltransferase